MKIWQPAFEAIFDQPIQESGNVISDFGNVFRYRTKTIKSGPVLESEIYPIWSTNSETRKARAKLTRAAQENLNHRNSVKRLIRLVNTNFTEKDIAITLTYEGPVPDLKQAQLDIRNYIRRVRDFRKKHNLPAMKYIYVIEGSGSGCRQKSAENQMELQEIPESSGEKVITRVHHHVIISGAELAGTDYRDVLERLWGKGWANSRRLQPDPDSGLEAIARYIAKERRGRVKRKPGQQAEESNGTKESVLLIRRWYGSRNLEQPKITVSDWKLSNRKVNQIATEIEDAPGTIFNKAYPGYQLTEVNVFSSEFVSGVYIHARMMKIKPPLNSHVRRKEKQNERNRITGCIPAVLPVA